MDSAQLGSVYYASSSMSSHSVAAIGNAVFIYLFRGNFNGLLTLQGCERGTVLSLPLSMGLIMKQQQHRVLSSAFDTSHLVRSCQIFVCALDAILALLFMAMSSGRAAGQELLSLSHPPTHPPSLATSVCAFYGHQNWELLWCCIWHAVAMRAPKNFSL